MTGSFDRDTEYVITQNLRERKLCPWSSKNQLWVGHVVVLRKTGKITANSRPDWLQSKTLLYFVFCFCLSSLSYFQGPPSYPARSPLCLPIYKSFLWLYLLHTHIEVCMCTYNKKQHTDTQSNETVFVVCLYKASRLTTLNLTTNKGAGLWKKLILFMIVVSCW